MKLHHKGNIDCQVKINIGVMIMKDGCLSIKRGHSLPLNVMSNITFEDLLEKAVEKHSHFHRNKKAFYQLLYADKNKVSGSLYFCSSFDYFDRKEHNSQLCSMWLLDDTNKEFNIPDL